MNTETVLSMQTTPERLWPFLVDPDRIQQWNPDVVSHETLTDGPPGVGAKSAVQIQEGSRVAEYVTEVMTYDPCELLVIKMTGGNLGAGPMIISYAITPGDDSLTLHVKGKWEPVGLLLRLLAPLFAILARRNSRAAMDRLKSLAEGDE